MKCNERISIFDFIALLLSDLKDQAASRYAGLRVKSYFPSAEYQNFITEFIEAIKLPYLEKNDSDYLSIVHDGISPDMYEKYISDMSFRKNTDAVYLLAWNMAKCFLNSENLLLASQEAFALSKHDNSVGFNQLNSDQSVRETGYILLPDLGTFGDENKINKTTTTFEKIYLKGLIILTPSDLMMRDGQQFKVKNIMPEKNTHLRNDLSGEILTIAVSPITDRWLLKSVPLTHENEFGTKEYCFQIEGLTDEEYITSRITKAYTAACDYHPHILLFPEMYGTQELSLHADEIIENVAGREAPLIIMSSWWHDNSNEAAVLDDSLSTLYHQPKHSPFLYRDPGQIDAVPALEELKNDDPLIFMYHIPRLGRLCVCICKDFLMDSYRRMLCEKLEASILLVPAFSPEVDHFKNCMDELKHAGTYGVFVNCCAAPANKTGRYVPVSNECVVGEVTLTRSVSNDIDPPFRLLKPICKGNCGGPDTCCVFIIQITNTGNITVKHIYS